MNKLLILLAFLLTLFIIKININADAPHVDTHHKFELYRDEHGIPRVLGRSKNDIAFGVGYAQAQDRLWTLFFKKMFVSGRTS